MNASLEYLLETYLNSEMNYEAADLFVRGMADDDHPKNFGIEAVEALFKDEKYKKLLYVRHSDNTKCVAYCLSTIGAIRQYIAEYNDVSIFLKDTSIPAIEWVYAEIFEHHLIDRMYEEDWFKNHEFFKVVNSSSIVWNIVYISDKNELLSLYDQLPDSHKDMYYFLLNDSNIIQNYVKYDVVDSLYVRNAIKVLSKLSIDNIKYILNGNDFVSNIEMKKLFHVVKSVIDNGVSLTPNDIDYEEVRIMMVAYLLGM